MSSSVGRYSRVENRKVNIPRPYSVSRYNVGMGGVDRMDQNVKAYRTGDKKRVVFNFYVAYRCFYSKCLAAPSEIWLNALSYIIYIYIYIGICNSRKLYHAGCTKTGQWISKSKTQE